MTVIIQRPSYGSVTVSSPNNNVLIGGTTQEVVKVAGGVRGEPGATGPQGPVGTGGALGLYGSFYDTSTQVNAASVNTITLNSTAESNGISIVSGSRITAASTGVYNVQFSAQVDKTDAGDDTIEIWLSKNGLDLTWTNTVVMVHANDGKSVPSWNFVLSLNAGDYLQLKWYSADAALRLLSVAAGVRPAIPSVILTVTQVMYTQVGPTGSPGVFVGASPPANTSLLWIDTSL